MSCHLKKITSATGFIGNDPNLRTLDFEHQKLNVQPTALWFEVLGIWRMDMSDGFTGFTWFFDCFYWTYLGSSHMARYFKSDLWKTRYICNILCMCNRRNKCNWYYYTVISNKKSFVLEWVSQMCSSEPTLIFITASTLSKKIPFREMWRDVSPKFLSSNQR